MPEIYPGCNSQCSDWIEYNQGKSKINISGIIKVPKKYPIVYCSRLEKRIPLSVCKSCLGRRKCTNILTCEGKTYSKKRYEEEINQIYLQKVESILKKFNLTLISLTKNFLKKVTTP